MKLLWSHIILGAAIAIGPSVSGQEAKNPYKIDGVIATHQIDDAGDTLIVADLNLVTVTAPRTFASEAEYRRYMKYRRYASQVYPYAVRSIKIFREVERDTEGMKKRKKRKHIRKLHKDLKKELTDPLKNLSRTQGKILVKMIEYELETPLFDLLKSLRGGLAATKWHSLGKLYGYDLKKGYICGEDEILDAILADFDISYEVN